MGGKLICSLTDWEILTVVQNKVCNMMNYLCCVEQDMRWKFKHGFPERAEFDLSLFDTVMQRPSFAKNISGLSSCVTASWGELEGM